MNDAKGAVTVLLALGLAASSLSAQNVLRRTPPVQPVAEVRGGDLLVGIGGGYGSGIRFPLLALEGDIARAGVVHVAYGLADKVLVEIQGDLFRSLTIQRMGEPLVEPDEGVADGKSTGAGDLKIGATFILLGGRQGPAFGARLGFNIPASNQAEGLGTNTTNIRLSALASYGRGRLRVTTDVGLGILEAPLENFMQNDVLIYSGEVLYQPVSGLPLRVHAGAGGRASTRGRVPVGTEDLGEVALGLDYRLRSWLLDARLEIGYTENSPDWELTGGLAFLLGR